MRLSVYMLQAWKDEHKDQATTSRLIQALHVAEMSDVVEKLRIPDSSIHAGQSLGWLHAHRKTYSPRHSCERIIVVLIISASG